MRLLLLSSLAVGQTLALQGWISRVFYNNNACSGTPLEAQSGGPQDIGASCDAYFQANPSQNAARACQPVMGSPGWYATVQCQLQDASAQNLIPCPPGAVGSWGTYNVYQSSACTGQASFRSVAEGNCLPANYADAPQGYQSTNCTAGVVTNYANAQCTQLAGFPQPNSQIPLNGQCNPEARPGTSAYFNGACRLCGAVPPVPPPAPPPVPVPPGNVEGLSGGAIAGIVIGALALAGLLIGLFIGLGKRKRAYVDPAAGLTMQEAQPEVKQVTTIETITTPVVTETITSVPVVTETITTSVPVVTETITTTTATTETVGASSVATVEGSHAGLNPIDLYAIGSQYTAAGAYTATKPTELSVQLGDFLRIDEAANTDGWVKVTNVTSGLSGWIPLSAIKGGY